MDLMRAVPILTVDDLAGSVASYRTVLGLDILMDHGWIVTLGFRDGAQFSLMTEDKTAPRDPAAALDVADVDTTYEQAVAAGLEIVHPLSDEDWGVRRFFLRDPAGNVVNVLSHR